MMNRPRRIMAWLLTVALAAGLCVPAMAADVDTYRTLYSGEITTLNYLVTASTNEFAVAANVIDTLVEYDNLGQIQPSLAKEWEVSDDGLTWTFHLRDDATWVTADGTYYANVTANDFVFAAKYILDAKNASSTADILYDVIEGAKAYYDSTVPPEAGQPAPEAVDFETVGVKAVDDTTLVYKLINPVPYFLSMTTYVCFMPANEQFVTEKGEGFGLATGNDTILYNGAYLLSEFAPQEKRVYTRNESNWDKDKVYIGTIDERFNSQADSISAEMYLRGEIDAASLSTEVATEWLSDPEKAEMIHPLRRTNFYSYFYAFNFDPHFDAEYEPDNWKLAVNNENFRKSFYYGFDRVKAMMLTDQDNAESLIWNTVTPPDFISFDGVDYSSMGALAPISALGDKTYDPEKAISFRDAAKAELTEAGVTFPVKVPVFYNPSVANIDKESQTVEQQLEETLGADYIDLIVLPGPTTGFLTAIRRSGNYAFMKCNWGPDYADPVTYTDPFDVGNNYNFMDIGAEPEGVNAYYDLVAAGKAIINDTEARYLAFADAEAYLIEHAYVVPFGAGSGGYTASRLDPFSAQYAPFGISTERYKGQKLLDKPMNTDEFFDAYDQWQEDRNALAAD